MKISKARQTELYLAIHEPITDLRVVLKFTPDVDVKVAQLEHAIWRRVRIALALQDQEAT